MANYVVNKIVCTEEILNEYFIDYYPIDQNEKLEELLKDELKEKSEVGVL